MHERALSLDTWYGEHGRAQPSLSLDATSSGTNSFGPYNTTMPPVAAHLSPHGHLGSPPANPLRACTGQHDSPVATDTVKKIHKHHTLSKHDSLSNTDGFSNIKERPTEQAHPDPLDKALPVKIAALQEGITTAVVFRKDLSKTERASIVKEDN
jgi:hypothetical protein